jgi:hypothetical protein
MKQKIFKEVDVDKVDKYLGPNTYYRWDELDADARRQWSRKAPTDKALWHVDTSLSAYSPYGVDKVEKLREDLIAGFDLLLLQNKVPDPVQFKTLLNIYEVAIDAASMRIDAVEGLPVINLVLGAVSVRFGALARQATILRDAIRILHLAIGDAMAEKVEAEIQAAFGIIANTIGLALPGISLLAKGGMTAADLLLDDALGPQKPEPISTMGDGAKVLAYTTEVMQKIKSLGATTKTVAKKAGGVFSISGYFFDLSEVALARRNLRAVQDAMTKAKAESAALTKLLEAEIPKLQKVRQLMTSGLIPALRSSQQKGWERDGLISAAGYSTLKPFPWKIVQDLSKVPAMK